MIFGKKDYDTHQWHKVFVIFPRRLIDGRWAMLHHVMRCDYLAPHIPSTTRYSALSPWCYKECPDD